MKKVAVILSGCGVFDGSEIHESVLTLLALAEAKAAVQCFAPDIPQQDVIDHVTGNTTQETRHVLSEAARIARGQIKPLRSEIAKDFDAAIFPGGSGAAKNLCDYALEHSACEVNPEVTQFIHSMHQLHKPLGFICIAPVIAAKVLGNGVRLTIGNDAATAKAINLMDANHVECPVTNCIIDEDFKVVSTPAYMLAQSITEVRTGISALVSAVLQMTG